MALNPCILLVALVLAAADVDVTDGRLLPAALAVVALLELVDEGVAALLLALQRTELAHLPVRGILERLDDAHIDAQLTQQVVLLPLLRALLRAARLGLLALLLQAALLQQLVL